MEWSKTECGKYRIESLTAATFPGALRVIQEAFFPDESVCIGAEVNLHPGAGEELLELCADAALDGMSLVAINIASGEVVSVAFNKIQEQSTDPSEKTFFEIFAEERCKYESSRSLIQFMADIDGRCNLFQEYGVDCSLEIMFLGTLREHRYKKIAKNLCEASIQLARNIQDGRVSAITLQDLGPKYSTMKPRKVSTNKPKIVQGIWTGEGTRRIGKTLNFKVHVTASMKEYLFEGRSYADRLGDDFAIAEVSALAL